MLVTPDSRHVHGHAPLAPRARHRLEQLSVADRVVRSVAGVPAALRPQLPALAAVAGTLLLWVVGWSVADPAAMGDLGLLTLFNSATVAALLLLLGSTVVCIYQHRPGWLIGLHLVVYLALVHGTPAVLYGTVRYAWTYKHLGIVDFILRTGTVDPAQDFNTIYHNWPGLLAATALVSELGDGSAAFTLALWAPVGFNLLLLAVLRYLFRGLTTRPEVVWLALLLFFTITWVGQDYYSPQAVALVLYLAVVGLLVRVRRGGIARTLTFTLLVAAMAVTHQITLVILFMAVTALVLIRRTRGWYLPLIVVVVVGTWALTFAGDYTLDNFRDLLSGFGRPLANAGATFDKSADAIGAQKLVAVGDRFTVVAAVVAALAGVWRTHRAGTPQWTAVILMLVPVAVLVQMSFGGEALLRVFLFAAPFIAFLAAQACAPRQPGGPVDVRGIACAALVLVLVLPGYFLGYYGKERLNRFTDREVEASAWVASTAPAGSLLVEGDTNYPRQFLDYEKFDYVAISREPSAEDMLINPPDTLQRWLSNPRFTEGYVIITRSQKIAVDTDGSMPAGSLARIEEALTASPLFDAVHRSEDATVFALSEQGRQ